MTVHQLRQRGDATFNVSGIDPGTGAVAEMQIADADLQDQDFFCTCGMEFDTAAEAREHEKEVRGVDE